MVKKKKAKKIVKIALGVIVFFTLPSLLFFGFLYFKYNEKLPEGIQGEQADALAYRMLDALDYEAYNNTDYLEWTFKNKHHFKWNKTENKCVVFWKNHEVQLDLKDYSKSKALSSDIEQGGKQKEKLIKKAIDYFNNDSFWLVAPYKVFDAGTERRLVTNENGNQSLLVSYTSGGSTPGDSYLWHLDKNGKPTSYQMWTSIVPIKGVEASWNDWITTQSGAVLPKTHQFYVLELDMGDVKGFNNQ